ncbi:MAG: hypothetical protein ACI9G1_004217 [Pirellulaceae bacterium]|jgi:hypothetical protein
MDIDYFDDYFDHATPPPLPPPIQKPAAATPPPIACTPLVSLPKRSTWRRTTARLSILVMLCCAVAWGSVLFKRGQFDHIVAMLVDAKSQVTDRQSKRHQTQSAPADSLPNREDQSPRVVGNSTTATKSATTNSAIGETNVASFLDVLAHVPHTIESNQRTNAESVAENDATENDAAKSDLADIEPTDSYVADAPVVDEASSEAVPETIPETTGAEFQTEQTLVNVASDESDERDSSTGLADVTKMVSLALASDLATSDESTATPICEATKGLGTTIQWYDKVADAAEVAKEKEKLIFLIQVSGNFSRDEFT